MLAFEVEISILAIVPFVQVAEKKENSALLPLWMMETDP